jgi:LPXTG-site transpeptidase (sortase) family protein
VTSSAPPRGRRREEVGRHELAGLCSELDELARDLSRPWPRWRARLLSTRGLLSVLAVTLIVAGIGIAAGPLIALVGRSRADGTAIAQWRHGGSQALVGSAPAAAPLAAAAHPCGGASPADSYALVSFPSLIRDGYSGVAGDGGWDLLLQRSMVHFHGSAAPGQAGNDIIAFHREPNYQHIDQLAVGDPVVVQDRSCRVWRYQIRRRWVLPPDRVTQLVPTVDQELTLITCDPWFRDDHRIVWQASPAAPTASARPPGPVSSVRVDGAAP